MEQRVSNLLTTWNGAWLSLSKEGDYEKEYNDFNEGIAELEDMIDRMNGLNTLYYDQKFHALIIKKYSNILKGIKESQLLKDDDKKLFVEIIVTLFKTLKTTVD